MRPARPTPRRRARTGAAAAGIALLAGSLAACGADSEDTASAGPDGSTSAVGNNLVTAMKPLDAYPVPTEKLDNVDSVAGKTIFYVPITKQAPQFTTTEKAVAAAAETVGLRLQVCDGKERRPTSAAA